MDISKSQIWIKKNTSQFKHYIQNYYLIACLLILPAVLAFFFITRYGVNVVFWDAWARIPLMEHYYMGTLSFNDLFAQHNEHRIFFFKIIFLIITPLTHWNVVMEIYLSWILIICTCLSLFYLYSRYWGFSKQSMILFLPIPWLLFMFRQGEGLLQGDQFCAYLCIFWFIISVTFIELSEKIDYKFGIALIGAIISTFSFFNGLLIWPIGFFLILLIKNKKRMFLGVWGFMGIVNYIIYFYDWVKPVQHPSIFYIINNPIGGLEYFIANIGSPLGYDLTSSISMGLLIIGISIYLAVVLLKNNLVQQNAIWLSITFFSVGSSVMMTLGRGGFGVIQAISSRYVAFTVFGIIGLYLIMLAIHRTFKNKNWGFSLLFGVIIGIIVFGIINGNISEVVSAENSNDLHQQLPNYLLGYSTATDDQLKQLYPDPTVVRQRAKFLEEHHLNVFYSPDNH